MSNVKSLSHEEAVKASLKSVRCFFVICALGSFLYASRTTIWVEYAKQFNDASMDAISWILYIDSVLIGVAGIVFSSLGDYIGFDKAVVLKVSFITIGCILESFATNFVMLSFGFLISQTATIYVTMAYIAWILPAKYAKIQISLLYAIVNVFCLIGPIFSGLLYKLFNNYQYVFIINSISMSIILIYSIFNLLGKQHKLQQLQIAAQSQTELEDNNELNSEEIFPSFLQYQKEQKQQKEQKEQNTERNNNHSNLCKDISFYQWYMILNMLIELGILWGFEGVIVTFYIPFILRKYDHHIGDNRIKQNFVLLSSLQIVVMSLSFIISSFIISRCTHLFTKIYKFIKPYLLLTLFFISFIMVSIPILFSFNVSIHLFWGYLIYLGIFIVISALILETLLLDIQPPKHAGKINGIKCLIQNSIRGVFLLIIGLIWDQNVNAIIYVICFGCFIGIILNAIMWIIHCIGKQLILIYETNFINV